jgi:two-component system sensor histidine kinase VicK
LLVTYTILDTVLRSILENKCFAPFSNPGNNRGKLVFAVLSLSIICACQQKKPDSQGYSAPFKPVFEKTSLLFSTNHVNQGLHYLDSSMSHISEPNLDDKFRTLGFHYIYWRRVKRDNHKALLCADSMLSIANKSTTQKQYVANYVEAHLNIGDIYFANQQFKEAYQHYFEGFRVGKNNLDNRSLSDYSYRMGMILYKMGHYKLAADYFKECYRLSTHTQDEFADFYRVQEVLDNIALSYKHNDEPDSAIFYFNKTLTYINLNASKFKNRPTMIEMAKGVVYGNKAEVLIGKGEYAMATDLLQKSIAINLQKGNDNADAELAEIKLAKIYLVQNQAEQLLALLNTMKPQLDSVKNENAEADWNRLMSKYYQLKKDFPKSLGYLQAYSILNDSTAKNLALLRESNVNEQLANFEKQYQIDNLKGTSELQRLYLYVAGVCALMAVIIIFLIFKNYKRSKRDITIVNALNLQVNLQKADLEKTLGELKESSIEKDQILRTVAHDLRNPIGGIAALSAAMEDDDFNEEQKQLINIIKETAYDSIELINEILEVTNSEKTELKKELVDVNSLLGKSVELLRFKAQEKHQQIDLYLLDGPVELSINREKIWRVISNLISNAIKFSPDGSTIHAQIKDFKKDVEISIKDYGIGIPENLQPKVFNMFTEAKRPGTQGEKSFGLGLSISKQIIENHNGKIWFESTGGKGSTFYIRLQKQDIGQPTLSKMKQAIAPTI